MKKINIKRLAVFAIAAVVLIAVLVNTGTYLFSLIVGMKITDTEKTVTTSVTSAHDFEQYNSEIAVVNSKGIEFFNNKGDYSADLAFKLYSPYIYTSGKFAAVADIGAQNALVLKHGKQAYKISEQEPISAISVNQNGYAAVLTSESGYKSTVVIYNNLGSKVYTWYSGDVHVVDVKISSNNKEFAVVGIEAEDSLKSVVKFFNINNENPVGEVIFDSELAYQLEYSGSNVLLVSDKGMAVVSDSGAVKKSYDFLGQTLLCFDIKNTKMPCVAISNAEGGSDVIVLSSSLKEKGRLVIDGTAKMLDQNKKSVVICNGNSIFLVNSGGNMIAEGEMHKDIENIKLADDKKHIFTLSGSNLGVYKIEYGR